MCFEKYHSTESTGKWLASLFSSIWVLVYMRYDFISGHYRVPIQVSPLKIKVFKLEDLIVILLNK